jgi:hypothetical protein
MLKDKYVPHGEMTIYTEHSFPIIEAICLGEMVTPFVFWDMISMIS